MNPRVVAEEPCGGSPELSPLSGATGTGMPSVSVELADRVDLVPERDGESELSEVEPEPLDEVTLFAAAWPEALPPRWLCRAGWGALAGPVDSVGGAESAPEGGSEIGLAAPRRESDCTPLPTSPPPPFVALPTPTPA